MNVEIDESRHHVHPGRVHLVLGALWSAIGAQRKPRGAGAPYGRDLVPLDDDVDGAAGRAAGAVDEHRTADDERLERPLPLIGAPVRRGAERLVRRGRPLRCGGGRTLLRGDGRPQQSHDGRDEGKGDSRHVYPPIVQTSNATTQPATASAA